MRYQSVLGGMKNKYKIYEIFQLVEIVVLFKFIVFKFLVCSNFSCWDLPWNCEKHENIIFSSIYFFDVKIEVSEGTYKK